VAASEGEGDTQIGVAVLHWAETDRVMAIEPVLDFRKELGDDKAVSAKLVLDSLSGASHNGAGVQNYTQTFSSASGGAAGYAVAPGAVPLDPSFEDFRTAVSVGYETALANPLWKATVGASVSSETDFLSLAASGTLARDFNRRNTTVLGGLSVESDSIEPAGGAPVPFALRPVGVIGGGGEEEEEEEEGEDGDSAPPESRRVVDAMIGITQVINRRTLMQFNVAVSEASGYMNDPYKVVTVDTPVAGYVNENRPDSRSRLSMYWGAKHAFASENVLDAGYRWMRDDWGIVSHTFDVYYRVAMPGNWYIEPHARWYTQSAADFFVMSFAPADVPLEGSTGVFASGDYRLGALQDTTVGARVGLKLSDSSEVYLRAEQFTQRGDWEPASLDATILELGGSWRF
jgi:hypothetical protein